MDSPPSFLSLPPEDMIYAYFPHKAYISLNHRPCEVQQPVIARLGRQIRIEALDSFYSQNNFVLDLRGWTSYSKLWTPADIFGSWIHAIGDHNAARLRSLKLFANNFRVVIKIFAELPVTIDWKLRVNTKSVDLADRLPTGYDFEVATRRVRSAFATVIENFMQAVHKDHRRLTSADINHLKNAVANLQPILCSRVVLGWHGAVLEGDDLHEEDWPDLTRHLEKCDDCGYLRYANKPGGS